MKFNTPSIKHNERLTFSGIFNIQHSLFEITIFSRATQNANSPLFLLFNLLCDKPITFAKDSAPIHLVFTEIAFDRGQSNFEFCKYQRSPELTERTCHCIMQLELSNYIFGFLTICKPCLF